MAWYKNGRVTINNGDTYLTGINTRFASNTRVGDAIRAPDGEWYELVNTSSETVLGIYPPYRGASVVDSSDYMIAPIQGYNKETADRLRYITDNIRDFTDDVNAARESAEAAKASEDAAAQSAVKAKASEDTVHADAVAAANSRDAAAQSASNADQSQQAASISETNAKKSETNASLSETNTAASELAAANSAEAARLSEEAAAQSELNAAMSESAAKTSETNAKTSEVNANEDATTANTDAATSTQARLDALEALRLAEKARDDAIAAANANTGQVQDLGLVDLSSGVYPARPVVSSFWYVSVGGTVTADGETITYGASDVLRFSKPLEKFYKIDNTEEVTSVAGKTGVVVLDKVDVGLGRVDNTNDLEKPVSNAVQDELDIRKPMTDRTDTTAGHIVTVGGFGENGGTPIIKIATDDANQITVSGTYVFSNGGVNLPTASNYYIKHVNNEASGYAKQFAHSVTQNTQPFFRTKSANVWSDWRLFVDIVDGLTSTRPDAALSANAGRLLQEQLQANNATIVQYSYNLTAGQLVISGTDLSGKNLSYVPGAAIIVSLNGFSLLKGTDFTATTGESISLSKAIEETSEVLITVFGAFAIANHYTKSEEDALLAQKVSINAVIDVSHGGTGKTTEFRKGYIDGLKLISVGDNAITVTAGSAYIPSLGKIVELTSNKAFTALVALAPRSQHHFYLYENNGVADVEVSLTAPQSYFGSSYQKNGDSSRRYLFSVLSGTTGFYSMHHEIQTGRMNFIGGTPNSPPFLITNYNGTTPTLVDVVISNSGVNSIAPRETTTQLHTVASMPAAGSVYTTPADQLVAPSNTTWGNIVGGGTATIAPLVIRPSRSGASLGNYYIWVSASTVTLYGIGYTFER